MSRRGYIIIIILILLITGCWIYVLEMNDDSHSTQHNDSNEAHSSNMSVDDIESWLEEINYKELLRMQYEIPDNPQNLDFVCNVDEWKTPWLELREGIYLWKLFNVGTGFIDSACFAGLFSKDIEGNIKILVTNDELMTNDELLTYDEVVSLVSVLTLVDQEGLFTSEIKGYDGDGIADKQVIHELMSRKMYDYSKLALKDRSHKFDSGYESTSNDALLDAYVPDASIVNFTEYGHLISDLEISLAQYFLSGLNKNERVNFVDREVAEELYHFVTHNTLALIRMKRYGGHSTFNGRFFWGAVAGEPSYQLIKSYEDYESPDTQDNEQLNESVAEVVLKAAEFHSLTGLIDPNSQDIIDAIHMIAVLQSNVYDSDMDDGIEVVVDYLSGWGGDLLTFLADVQRFSDSVESDDKDSKLELLEIYVTENLGQKTSTHFSREDYLADLDGVNIAGLMQSENLLLSEAVICYYDSGDASRREVVFIKNFGDQSDFLRAVNTLVNHSTMTDEHLEDYDITSEQFHSVFELFEDVFMYREAEQMELDVIEQGFIQLIMAGDS